MTAAHVVCDKDDKRRAYGAKDIELRFGDGSQPVKVTGVAVVTDAFHPDEDWALLAVPAEAAKAAPIGLDQEPGSHPARIWNIHPADRTPLIRRNRHWSSLHHRDHLTSTIEYFSSLTLGRCSGGSSETDSMR
jgi:hypothetical protein